MSAVKIFVCLEIEQNITFYKGLGEIETPSFMNWK